MHPQIDGGVMWYKDTPGQQDKRTTDNKGFTARKKLTALSKSVQMMGKLHLDLFCQDLPVGTVSTFTSTRLTGYLQLVFSNAFT
jgi:hypothetical protein